MMGPRHGGVWLDAVMRALRCKPKNYWQVWLIDAARSSLVLLIIWSAFGKPLAGHRPDRSRGYSELPA